MALLIQGSFQLDNGIELNQLYVRTNAMLSIDGDVVGAYPEYWIDKNAYDQRKDAISLRNNWNFNFAYNRDTDGADILVFANQKAKETFEAQGFTATIIDL